MILDSLKYWKTLRAIFVISMLVLFSQAVPAAPQSAAEVGVTDTAGAGDAGSGKNGASLWALLAAHEQAQGAFVQTLLSETGDAAEESKGRYAVLRPGYFRWEISWPDQQLLVVANNVLWHYDIDLATATRRDRPSEAAGQFTALELLGGDNADLAQRFYVESVGPERFRLIPRFAQAGFASVEMQWRDGALVNMNITDRSGQQIQLELYPDANAEALAPEYFIFEPPPDVDVYDATAS